MNILVIKQSSLGDVLHSTAALRAIKAEHPNSHLTVLTNQASSGILENNPDIDELVLFDYALVKKQSLLGIGAVVKEFNRVKKRLNSRHYDLAFDLQGLLRSVLFLYAATASKKYVKGRWLGLQGFRNKTLHAIDEMAAVLNLAGIVMESKKMRLMSTAEESDNAAQVLGTVSFVSIAGSLPLIVISPFTRWYSKNWPLASFIALADQLSQNGECEVVITGTAEDKATINAEMAKLAAPWFVNLAGTLSLGELAALMTKADLVISGDSFPMHLASAVDTPLVALFGPTDESKTGPLGEATKVIRPEGCDKCDRPNCPRACLGRVSVERVLEEVNGFLG
ncbi:MAG: lipopolysaccharide heptosyltransferase II [Parvicella sp.]